MTYEAEMKEYLQAKKLPAGESTYQKEFMTMITIEAFGELLRHIYKLKEDLKNSQDAFKRIKDIIDEGV